MRSFAEAEQLRIEATLRQIEGFSAQRLPSAQPMRNALGSNCPSGAYDENGNWVNFWKAGDPVGSAPVGP